MGLHRPLDRRFVARLRQLHRAGRSREPCFAVPAAETDRDASHPQAAAGIHARGGLAPTNLSAVAPIFREGVEKFLPRTRAFRRRGKQMESWRKEY